MADNSFGSNDKRYGKLAKKKRLKIAMAKVKEMKSTREMKKVGGAADEVSAAISAMFSTHANQYQSLANQANAFHDQFIQALGSGAGAYTSGDKTD